MGGKEGEEEVEGRGERGDGRGEGVREVDSQPTSMN